jgi:ABC-2 type transport system permease protein
VILDAVAGFRMQLLFYSRRLDMLIPLLTSPLYTVIFTLIVRVGGRQDLVGYSVLAPFYMSLWWFALYCGGWVIQTDRWEGTLESVIATPANFRLLVFGRVAATAVPGLVGFVEVWSFGRYIIGAQLVIHHLLLLLVSLVLTLFAMVCTALLMTALFVLARNAVTFSNSASFPFYVLGGILAPITLLPGWLQPVSKAIFLSWSAELLRDSLDTRTPGGASFALWMLVILSISAFVCAYVLLGHVIAKLRHSGGFDHR